MLVTCITKGERDRKLRITELHPKAQLGDWFQTAANTLELAGL